MTNMARCLSIVAVLAGVAVLLLNAQQQPAPQAETSAQDLPRFNTTVDVVVAPVTVFDRNNSYVSGLQPHQFHLYDNDKEQNIRVDESFQPISLVIAIQANSKVEAILPQVQKIGVMMRPEVIGDAGEAAVVAFDHRIRVVQEFTGDPDKIAASIKKLTPGSYTSRMVDAVDASVRLLGTRPAGRRRIVLLISETRDAGSEGRVKYALWNAQLRNVTIYAVDMSRFISTLTAKPGAPRPDPNPPAMRPLPPNVVATPTTVAQTWGTQGGRAEFIPLMVEVFKDVKAVFKDNPVELFTKGTGGSEYSFYKQRGLEQAISKIGEELHSQYLLSYNPSNTAEGGFHKIQVRIAGRQDVRVLTRPGYWLAPK
jgi:VWFA-related protein